MDSGYDDLINYNFESKMIDKFTVEELLSQLKIEDRIIIIKIYLENETQKDVAKELNINYDTLKTRVRKILKVLRTDNAMY